MKKKVINRPEPGLNPKPCCSFIADGFRVLRGQLAMLKNSAAKKPCGFVEVYELRLAQRGEMRAGSTPRAL